MARSDFADVIFRDHLAIPWRTCRPWRGQSCQECHYAHRRLSPDARACVLNPAGSRSGELPVHEFVGGNTWVPKLLQEPVFLSGDGDRQAVLDRTAALRLSCSASAVPACRSPCSPGGAGAGTLTAQVKVINLSGHKLPTGYSEGGASS